MKATITINYRGHEADITLDDLPDDMTHDRLIEDFMEDMSLTILDENNNPLPQEGE